MTDAERLEREREWIKTRFECTGDAIFRALVAVMGADVESFNKLSGADECSVNRISGREVTFARNDRAASVSTDGTAIWAQVTSNGHTFERIDIESKWNDAEMNCDLFIDSEPVSIYRASQKIIGSVLFPNG